MFAHLRGRDKDDGSAGDGEASAAEERIASVDEDADESTAGGGGGGIGGSRRRRRGSNAVAPDEPPKQEKKGGFFRRKKNKKDKKKGSNLAAVKKADLVISSPGEFQRLVHVDHDLNWTGKDGGQDPTELFTTKDKLGEGAFGAVYRVIHNESGIEMAAKVIPIQKAGLGSGGSAMDEIRSEMDILKRCRHKNVVSYYGCFGAGDEYLWIIMDYCSAGSLTDAMERCGHTLSDDQIGAVCRSVLEGLKHLHKINVVHRDIKAANILLTDEGGKGRCKIADFGVSKTITSTVKNNNTVVGTPYWMAPEVIKEGYADAYKGDIWSLGITAIELADGYPPLAKMHPIRAMFHIPMKPPPTVIRPSVHSDEFNAFVASCLVKNADDRPSAKNLLRHDFIRTARENTEDLLGQLITESLEAGPTKTKLKMPSEGPEIIKFEDLQKQITTDVNNLASSNFPNSDSLPSDIGTFVMHGSARDRDEAANGSGSGSGGAGDFSTTVFTPDDMLGGSDDGGGDFSTTVFTPDNDEPAIGIPRGKKDKRRADDDDDAPNFRIPPRDAGRAKPGGNRGGGGGDDDDDAPAFRVPPGGKKHSAADDDDAPAFRIPPGGKNRRGGNDDDDDAPNFRIPPGGKGKGRTNNNNNDDDDDAPNFRIPPGGKGRSNNDADDDAPNFRIPPGGKGKDKRSGSGNNVDDDDDAPNFRIPPTKQDKARDNNDNNGGDSDDDAPAFRIPPGGKSALSDNNPAIRPFQRRRKRTDSNNIIFSDLVVEEAKIEGKPAYVIQTKHGRHGSDVDRAVGLTRDRGSDASSQSESAASASEIVARRSAGRLKIFKDSQWGELEPWMHANNFDALVDTLQGFSVAELQEMGRTEVINCWDTTTPKIRAAISRLFLKLRRVKDRPKGADAEAPGAFFERLNEAIGDSDSGIEATTAAAGALAPIDAADGDGEPKTPVSGKKTRSLADGSPESPTETPKSRNRRLDSISSDSDLEDTIDFAALRAECLDLVSENALTFERIKRKYNELM